jgi:hypothetical protein
LILSIGKELKLISVSRELKFMGRESHSMNFGRVIKIILISMATNPKSSYVNFSSANKLHQLTASKVVIKKLKHIEFLMKIHK